MDSENSVDCRKPIRQLAQAVRKWRQAEVHPTPNDNPETTLMLREAVDYFIAKLRQLSPILDQSALSENTNPQKPYDKMIALGAAAMWLRKAQNRLLKKPRDERCLRSVKQHQDTLDQLLEEPGGQPIVDPELDLAVLPHGVSGTQWLARKNAAKKGT